MGCAMSSNKGKSTDPLIVLEAAIEGISYSLSQIKEVPLEDLTGPNFIDLVARLNAQSLFIEKTLEPMKNSIKARALVAGQDTVKGKSFQAVVSRVTKSVLDIPKVKDFLGRKLSQFMKEREEIHLIFQVKE